MGVVLTRMKLGTGCRIRMMARMRTSRTWETDFCDVLRIAVGLLCQRTTLRYTLFWRLVGGLRWWCPHAVRYNVIILLAIMFIKLLQRVSALLLRVCEKPIPWCVFGPVKRPFWSGHEVTSRMWTFSGSRSSSRSENWKISLFHFNNVVWTTVLSFPRQFHHALAFPFSPIQFRTFLNETLIGELHRLPSLIKT
jgi:hypothetical protein